MMKAALTGSMGSGKSYVLNLLKEKGYPIISADEINRLQLLKGHEGYLRIVEAFSEEILDEQEEIDKKKLASLVFLDDKKRKRLESITHPLILDEIHKWALGSKAELVFAEVPLLFEANLQDQFDVSIVVYADEETVFKRLYEGRQISRDEAQKRLAKQMSVKAKLELADYSIDNSEGADLKKQLDQLIKELKERV